MNRLLSLLVAVPWYIVSSQEQFEQLRHDFSEFQTEVLRAGFLWVNDTGSTQAEADDLSENELDTLLIVPVDVTESDVNLLLQKINHLNKKIYALYARRAETGKSLWKSLATREYGNIIRKHEQAFSDIELFAARDATRFGAILKKCAERAELAPSLSDNIASQPYHALDNLCSSLCESDKIPEHIKFLVRDIRTLFDNEYSLETYRAFLRRDLKRLRITPEQAETLRCWNHELMHLKECLVLPN